MSSQVGNSLLIKTILSPVCDFSHADNKQTLVNRIKKLDQKERKALKEELDFLSQRMKTPEKIRDIDLKEKGLCALLLVDDGTAVKTHNCFVSFCLGISNWFGRVGSSSLVSQLESVRQNLKSMQGLAESTDPVDFNAVQSGLADRIQALQAENAMPNGDEQFGEVIEMLGALKTMFAQLTPDPTVSELTAILTKITMIQSYVDANPTVFTKGRKERTDSLTSLTNLMTTLNSSATMQAFVTSQEYRNAHLIGHADRILPRTPNDKSEAVIKHELLKCIIVPSARFHLQGIRNDFQREIDSGSIRKSAREQEIAVLQGRLLFISQGKTLTEIRNTIKKAEENCFTLAQVHDSLQGISLKGSEFLASAQTLHDLVEKRPGKKVYEAVISDHPSPKTFGQCLVSILDILKGDAAKNEDLAKSLQLELYQIKKEQEPGTTLHSFIENPVAFKLDSNDAKQKLAEAYIDYLKAVTRTKYEAEERSFNQKRDKVKSLVKEMRSGTGGSPLIAVPVTTTLPPPAWVIPAQAPDIALNGTNKDQRESLIAIAKAIDSALATDTSQYAQLQNHQLESVVLQNFYFIALGADKIQTENSNWGGEVFHAKSGMNALVKNATQEELKTYRMMALVFAINGITAVKSVNLTSSEPCM